MKSLLVLFVLSLCVFPALSQEGPDIFEIEGVTAPATYVNGIYERSATIMAGCPCYNRKGDLGLIYKNSRSFFNGASLIDLTPPAPIPTLSQWALFILGLSLTSLAVVRISKMALA